MMATVLFCGYGPVNVLRAGSSRMSTVKTVTDLLTECRRLCDDLRLDEAVAIFQAILAQKGYSPGIAKPLLSTLLATGRTDDAATLLRIAERVAPEDYAVLADLHRRFTTSAEPDLTQVGAVIVPAYNAAATITRTLDSIARAAETLRREQGRTVQLVVVDDSSPDATAEVCRDWARRHDDIELLLIEKPRNAKAGAARNTGVAAARGELVWFLDADDEFLPDHLSRGWAIMAVQDDIAFVKTDLLFEDVDALVTEEWRLKCLFTHSINLCIRRRCFDFIGGYPEYPEFFWGGEDVGFSEKLYAFFRGAVLRRKTALYHRRPGNSLDGLGQVFTGEKPMAEDVELTARMTAGLWLNLRDMDRCRRRLTATADLPGLRRDDHTGRQVRIIGP